MASALLGGIGPGANLVVDLRRASATQRQHPARHHVAAEEAGFERLPLGPRPWADDESPCARSPSSTRAVHGRQLGNASPVFNTN
jgi:hypothetical protein